MTASFSLRTELRLPAEQAFDLARSIDAHTRSLAHTGERAVSGVTSGLIGPGEWVTWRGWHFGLPLRLTGGVTEYARPERFVDEQRRGPFRFLRHEHRFEPLRLRDGSAGTLMIDEISFAAPLGPLGRFVEVRVLRPYLRRLIRRRNGALAALGTDEVAALLAGAAAAA